MVLLVFTAIVPFSWAQSTLPTLIFFSDTQEPMMVERLYMTYDHNEAATQRILFAILGEENVVGVIHAGDVTAHGSTSDA